MENNNNDEIYLRIIDQFPNPIWRAGLDGKCNFFNKNWLEFTGRTIEQEMGNGWAEGVHPDELEKCVADYMGYFNERKPFMLKYRLKNNDGTYHWLLDFGSPFFDYNNNFLGYIGSCYDINELENNKELLKLTGSMAKIGGWQFDIEQNILHWTDEVYIIHEVGNDFTPNIETAEQFYIGDSNKKIKEAIDKIIKDGEPFDVELQLKTAKDNIIWVRSLGRAFKVKDKVVKIFGTFQDITIKKNIEIEMEIKNIELEKMNKIMLGREEKMIDLKSRIAELEKMLELKNQQ